MHAYNMISNQDEPCDIMYVHLPTHTHTHTHTHSVLAIALILKDAWTFPEYVLRFVKIHFLPTRLSTMFTYVHLTSTAVTKQFYYYAYVHVRILFMCTLSL